jgi:predicted RNase H-like HicB family nuclease
MRNYTAIVERCTETGLFTGFIPGFQGAHTQGETLDELHQNLQEVIEMLLEDGEPVLPLPMTCVSVTTPCHQR